ncbi:MAG TPA: DUF2264 domain-containing protein [Candidatus Aphodomonas merdavium]|nr:DUF2264 domain-containing protein [Candidatus Aphodomonas merdavium]
MGNCVKDNPLRTRADVERAAVSLIEPLLPLLSPGKARLHLGDTGAVYPDEIAQMEAFARPLWAIVPMLAGGCKSVGAIWECWREGIIHGVDPDSPEYWGEVVDYDQRLVEMAVFGMGMAVAPKTFFFSLPERTQAQLYRWLDQINHHEMPKNNWTFFRVLVNIGFEICGLPFPQEQMREDFDLIESHYEGDGWYFDYFDQREYYTMWAFHYYGLIYSLVMKDRDPARSAAFLERAKRMAQDFACWFDKNGEALPYGRSLTYRFAQGAFYAALALAQAPGEAVDYGVMKRLLLSNMRRWFQKPIFTRDGVLTIGYGYPNLLMAEGYNAPGSPYWAMKSFACLCLPQEHPFWQAEEKPFDAPLRSLQPHARMLIVRSEDGSHVMAFTAGNHAHEHSHDEAKYEKFVYSTAFGFSVCKAQKLLKDGAFDSMLALSEDGSTFHPRYGCESYELCEDCVRSVWHPFAGVTVQTEIRPYGEWHLRIHRIHTDRKLYAAEGGFAICRDGWDGGVTFGQHAVTPETIETESCAAVIAPWGVSGVRGLAGFETGEIVMPEPNTNLMVPRTLLPTMRATLPAGDSVLVSAVLGTVTGGRERWENPPTEVRYDGTMD